MGKKNITPSDAIVKSAMRWYRSWRRVDPSKRWGLLDVEGLTLFRTCERYEKASRKREYVHRELTKEKS